VSDKTPIQTLAEDIHNLRLLASGAVTVDTNEALRRALTDCVDRIERALADLPLFEEGAERCAELIDSGVLGFLGPSDTDWERRWRERKARP
jgi:hypothetical protein